MLAELFVQNFVCFSSAVVRRDVFSHVGAFDPQWDLAIDYDLWLRVAKHYEFDFVDEELVKYRTGHGNLSKKLARPRRRRRCRSCTAPNRATASPTRCRPTRIAEAYASTHRTLAYVLRASEPVTSAKWYLPRPPLARGTTRIGERTPRGRIAIRERQKIGRFGGKRDGKSVIVAGMLLRGLFRGNIRTIVNRAARLARDPEELWLTVALTG